MLKIYNTLTKQKEEFIPQEDKKVRMYACGITVYDECHIGHARSLYIFEVIRRYLKYRGFTVDFVRNITDIDDKIIKRAGELKVDWRELVEKYINSYYKDLQALGIKRDYKEPRATENIPGMIDYIRGLIDKGYAYVTESGVYFSVRKLQGYGKLSGQSIDDMLEGVRIDTDEHKQDALDFALWKKAKPGEPCWVSPWGEGRPGWHIECSVMSQKYLNVTTLDIHGGGLDLVFPHHENERAQAEAFCGKQFAKYWMHHGLLSINGQKMSKSLGNFLTIKEALKKYPADILKMFYLHAHYSSTIDFSPGKMEEAKKAYERIYILLNKLKEIEGEKNVLIPDFHARFIRAMDDDFNMPQGLAVLFEAVNYSNKLLESDDLDKTGKLAGIKKLIKEISGVFVLDFKIRKYSSEELPAKVYVINEKEIEEKISLRLEYKKERRYGQADAVRSELLEKGVVLEDTKEGTTWRRKI